MAADENDFVCTPRHRTYWYAKDQGAFTVSYPRPDQVTLTDLVAGLATSTEAAIKLVDKLTGIPALNVLDPASRDPLRRLLARTLDHPELEPA